MQQSSAQDNRAIFESYAAKEIEHLQATHKHLATFESELRSVASLLDDLPRKVEHEILVPFGPIAYFTGRLVHTNEVKSLIGDDYYIQWTAPEAKASVERRLLYVRERIEANQKHVLNSQERIKLSASTLGAADTPAVAANPPQALAEDQRAQDDDKVSLRTTAEGFIEIMEHLSDDEDVAPPPPSPVDPTAHVRPISNFKAKRALKKS